MALLTIAGTVSVTKGSANITFSQVQTLPIQLSLQFGSDAVNVYQLNAAIAGATAGVLTFPFNGTTNAATPATVIRQIILLDCTIEAGVFEAGQSIFWLVPQPSRVRPAPTFKSAVPQVSQTPGGWGATAAELALLQSGNLVEQSDATVQGLTAGGLEVQLAARYNQAQQAFSAQGALGSKLVGAYFDGNSWTLPP